MIIILLICLYHFSDLCLDIMGDFYYLCFRTGKNKLKLIDFPKAMEGSCGRPQSKASLLFFPLS